MQIKFAGISLTRVYYHKQKSIPASLRLWAVLRLSRASSSLWSAEENKQKKVNIENILQNCGIRRQLSNGHDIPEDLLIESLFMGDFA